MQNMELIHTVSKKLFSWVDPSLIFLSLDKEIGNSAFIFGQNQCLVTQLCPALCDPHGLYPTRLLCPWGLSREEYWSGLPCPPPGDPPDPGIDPPSLIHWQARSLPLAPPVNPICREHHVKCR